MKITCLTELSSFPFHSPPQIRAQTLQLKSRLENAISPFMEMEETLSRSELCWETSINADPALLQCPYTGVGRSQCHCGTASHASAFRKGKGWILRSLGTRETSADRAAFSSCEHYPSRSLRKMPQLPLMLAAQHHFMSVFC